MTDFRISISRNKNHYYFLAYSEVSEATGFSYDEVTGIVTDEVFAELAEHAVEKGKKRGRITC